MAVTTTITDKSIESDTLTRDVNSNTIVLKKDQIVLGQDNTIKMQLLDGSGKLVDLGQVDNGDISVGRLEGGTLYVRENTDGDIEIGSNTAGDGTGQNGGVYIPYNGGDIVVDESDGNLLIGDISGGEATISEISGGSVDISKLNGGAVDIAEFSSGDCDIKVNGGYLFTNLTSGRVLINSDRDMSGGAIYIGCTANGTNKTIKKGTINLGVVDGEQYGVPYIEIASLTTADLSIGSVNQEHFNYPPYPTTNIDITTFYNGSLTISSCVNGTIKTENLKGGMDIVEKQTGGIVSLRDYQKGDIYLTMNLSELKKNMERTLIKPDGSYNNGLEPTNKFSDNNNHQYFNVNVGSTGTGDFYLIQCEIYYGGTGTVRHYLYYDSQCSADGAQECLPLDKGPNVSNSNGKNPATLHLMCRKDSSNLYFQMYYCDDHNWPTCNSDGTDYTLYSSTSGNQRTCFNYLHVYKLGMVLAVK
jgi:hypothetical protein